MVLLSTPHFQHQHITPQCTVCVPENREISGSEALTNVPGHPTRANRAIDQI